MGSLTRAFNWNETRLGSPESWPQSLRTTLGLLLHSAFPMFLFWGEDLICFYNDAYRPSLGTNGKHPALGKPGKEVWPEIWDFIGPLIDQVMTTGEPVWFENQLVPIFRNGQLEDVYWTFSYSPAYGDEGEIVGVLVTCTETTAQVMTLKNLRESEARFGGAVQAVRGILWTNNALGEMEGEQPAWAALTGQTYDEYQGFGWANAIHPDDAQPTIHAWQEALAQNRMFVFEHRVRLRTGDYGQFSVRAVPLLNADGSIREWVGVHNDITEQVLAQHRMQQSQQQLLALFEQAPVGVAIINEENLTFRMANPFYGQLVGRNPADLIEKPLLEALPEIAGQGFDELLRHVLATGIPYAANEVAVNIQYGTQLETIYVDFLYQPRYNAEAKRFTDVLAVVTDVTKQVRSRQQVEVSEAKLRSLITAAPVAIGLFVGRDLVIELPNQTFIDIVGKGPDIVGKPLREVMPELITENQPFLQILDDVYTSGKMFQTYGAQVDIVQQGVMTHNYYNITYSPLYNKDGEVYAILDVAVDVTGQIQAQHQVEESEARFRNLVNQATVATAVFTGRDMVVELANDALLELWDKDRSILGKTLLEVLPEIADQPFPALLDQVFTTGETFTAQDIPAHLIRKGKLETIYVDFSYQALRDTQNTITGILVMATDVTERAKNRQKIEEAEAKLRSLINNAPAAIALFIGRDLIIDSPNQAFIDVVGKGSDIEGKPLRAVMPELESQPFLQLLDEVFTSGESFQSFGSAIRVLQQGREVTVYYNLTYTPLFDEVGEVYAILNIGINVADQIRAQQALQQSEQKLRSLIESAPFPIGVYVGREMRIELANQSILDVWGKGNNVIGKRYAEILPELDNQQIFDQLDGVYTTGIPFHAKNQRVDIVVDGQLQPYYFNYSFTPLIDAVGQIYGVMNTAAEVTDLAVAKQKVEEAETALRGAIELAELVTWRLYIEQGFIVYSERFMEWLGFSEDTKALDEAYNPLPDSYRESVAQALEASWQPGNTGFYENEHPIINRLTGQIRIIHARGEVQYDSTGKPLFINGTARDITHERQRQQELERQVQERTAQLQELVHDLERSNYNLQQFAYVASHDLQEPLRKIQSFGDLLKTEYGERLAEGQDYLNRMQASAGRMSVLIKDLLTYSRISTRQETSVPVQLDTVVQSVLQDLEVAIQEAGARIEVSKLPTILGDKTQLRQLFQNLIGNALKFRQDTVQPYIQITTQLLPASELPAQIRPARQSEIYYQIDIQDNGIGFNQKYVDRIFQVFQRLHGKNEYVGTGIGLAICEKVATNHGGAISATSQPDKGATFSVYLPK